MVLMQAGAEPPFSTIDANKNTTARAGSTEITHIMSPANFLSSQLLQPCQEHPTTLGTPNWTLLWQICSLESFGCEKPENQPSHRLLSTVALRLRIRWAVSSRFHRSAHQGQVDRSNPPSPDGQMD